jgi:hypothetical protein
MGMMMMGMVNFVISLVLVIDFMQFIIVVLVWIFE